MATKARVAPPQLRVYLPERDLQRQFAAFMGTPARARGYPPEQGEYALIVEVAPALFAAVAANEAERAAPGVTLVDVSMIGAAGRIYMCGGTDDVLRAEREIAAVLGAVEGRDHEASTGEGPDAGP
ncbi:MAG TPA: hypothetical protein VKD26_12090 [Streptosporangiaceae bacterium]|nr:hypothetical protein [Streptosporangiaceae bacterium]